MKVKKYIYNPDKKGVFKVSVVEKPANEADLVLLSALDLDLKDAPIVIYADMMVTNEDGKVLLLKRNSDCEFEPNKWGFAGGKVMPGETTKEGAIRECLEECGVIIDEESVKRIGEIVNNDGTTSHYFSGNPSNDVKLGNEHQDFAYVDSSDLSNYDLILNNESRFSDLIEGKVKMSAQEIKGVFYAPVLIPDLKIQRVDEATNEPYMSYFDADTIENLSNNYFKNGGNTATNLDHEDSDVDGVYPVESWIVQDPSNDKSNSIGLPNQVKGTWIMGYKCDSPEVLQKLKDKLLNGLSIEGQLDLADDTNDPISKFNKVFMKKTPLEFAKHLANVIMSAVSDEEKDKAEDATEVKMEDETADEPEKEKEVEVEMEDAPTDAPAEPSDLEKENATLKAENEELMKKVSDLEAELATYKNDAVLMSEQLTKVESAFDKYKTVQMSSQRIGDTPKVEVKLSEQDKKYNAFLEEVKSKL